MSRTQELERQEVASLPALGLCASCEQQPACTYTQDGMRAVLQCDEYAVAATPPRAGTGGGRATVHGTGAPERSAGLCSSCAGRDTCAFPRPEGGVWRCEEYE